MPCNVTTSSANEAGANLASALAILSVKLSLRMLPTITTMLKGEAMGCPSQAGTEEIVRTYSGLGKRCKCMNCASLRGADQEAAANKKSGRLFGGLMCHSQDRNQSTGFQAEGIRRYFVPSFS